MPAGSASAAAAAWAASSWAIDEMYASGDPEIGTRAFRSHLIASVVWKASDP